jgi:(1->4)-alpha-D-glucan 1-alpha-D-glucosylmutase
MKKNKLEQFCYLSGIDCIVPDGGDPGKQITEERQQTFLAALGLPDTDAAHCEQALNQLHRDHWLLVINPVLVAVEATGPLYFELRLPETMLQYPLHWHFTEENGTSHEGEILPNALKKMAEAHCDGVRYVSLRLPLTPQDYTPPLGYHHLWVTCTDGADTSLSGQCQLILTPQQGYTPPGLLQEARIWGVSCHLDTIRSRRNWGIGDLTDLHHILRWAAENGAATVAVSPLLSRRLPRQDGLYPALPSSRCFLDPLFLDLEAVADFRESEDLRALVQDPAFQVRIAKLRDAELVEYEEVAALKKVVAEALWQHFQLNHLNPETERGWNFRHFQQTGGQSLQAFALYEALGDHDREQAEETGAAPFRSDPMPDPSSVEGADLAATHQERIAYHQYLQWQLELQLAEVGKRSLELGLKVGLTLSLPPGVDPEGAEVWSQPSFFAGGLRVQDATGTCYPLGPPLLTAPMVAEGYASFINMIRCTMRYAGALRLDAIELLERQQWHETKTMETPGLLVAPPAADLLGIIALESRRNRCLIIGDHRAPLSAKFSKVLLDRGVLIGIPGFFENDHQEEWPAPSLYPGPSVVMASRYDLCSLGSLWQGRDIALLANHCPSFDSRAQEHAVITRASARARLLVALKRENLLPPGYAIDPAEVAVMTPELINALYAFLSRTPAKIVLVHLIDLPVASDQDTPPQQGLHPAWRQRLPTELESMALDEPIKQLFREFCQERTIGVVRPSAPQADRKMRQGYTIPRSFYRLQFSREFTFLQAAAIVPYLKELGISHCYASPYLKARPGSPHGYDIIDHSALNPEIGSRKEYEEFVAALDRNGMAQILDMVPNHMGVGPDNQWWVDVLENGQASPYADFFDINWQPQEEGLKNRILLPVLGDYFGVALEQGRLRLVFLPEKGRFFISYYEHFYPLAPKTYPHILGHDLSRLETRLGSNHEGFLELQSLIASFANLPGREETDQELLDMRNRNKEVLKRLLARLCREAPEIALFIEENVIYYNGEPGRPESFDPLEALLALQPFRLAFWRVASDEINYRRFFDINDLAGIRMEHKAVFDATHAFIIDLIATGKIDGLRIDHPDGLYDPKNYFRRLQAAATGTLPEQWPIAETGASVRDRQAALPLYVVVEKILSDFEQLPDDWMVHGTSGYDFSCLLNGLFVDRLVEQEMTALYHEFIGHELDFVLLVHNCKRLIIKTAMAGEINVLSELLHRLAKRNRYTQDYTLNGLRTALTEIVAFFPVYRTYFPSEAFSKTNKHYVEMAVTRAKARQHAEDTAIYDFIQSVLLLESSPRHGGLQKKESVDFIMRFQQYTGPVMAKGLEDTAFYIYNRLLSLNEVGGDPCHFGVSVSAFHAANQKRNANWPYGMLNTSTHDSKRSEDVRARMNVLSEMTAEWREALARWHELNHAKKTMTTHGAAPSKNDEYALYQNLLGIWPLEAMTGDEQKILQARFQSYMLKVIREAKVHSSWLNPHLAYEEAMSRFIDQLLDSENQAFLDDFTAFQRHIAWFGLFNSLSQLLLKLTAPGVPDIYQGSETWHFFLVDPDNRQPVDFGKQATRLAELRQALEETAQPLAMWVQELLQHPADGRIKMYCLWKALTYRRDNAALFQQGSYVPLDAAGTGSEHLCAFARMRNKQTLIVVVPRLVARLLDKDTTRLPLGREVWTDTTLPLPQGLAGHVFTNILTGEEITGQENGTGIDVADLFAHFPFALLVGG